MDLDREGFEATLESTRRQARETWKGSGEVQVSPVYQNVLQQVGGCDFLGYATDRTTTPVAAIIVDQQAVREAAPGQEIELVFPHTPFYGEAGGQVGDSGVAVAPELGVEIEIRDTQKPLEDLIVHRGVVKRGVVKPDMPLELAIDAERREAIRKNHTATHLLHAALRQVLGDHVKQAGSLVAPDRLRFDFTHFSRLSERDIERIETLVNEQIWANTALATSVQDLDSAIAGGALALFGEKYGDNVRTVQVPGFSHELCGGTHVGATGEIGFFTLTYEGGIGSGVRRVEALTGPGAFARVKREERVLSDLRQVLKAQPEEELDKLQRLTAQQRELERQVEALQQRLASAQTQDHFGNVQEVAGMKTLALCLDNFDRKALRSFVDTAKERLGSGVVVAGSVTDDKVALVAGVTPDLTARLSAGDLLGKVAALTGGKGGGRPDMAQGGGTDIRKLPEAIAQVPDIITALVGKEDDA
jgi:alanyl-tRNA synthetase